MQLYESNTEAVKSEIGTFLEVFPNGIVWGNTNEGKGYDLVLLGQVGADEDRRRRDPGEAAAARSTRRWRSRCARSACNSAVDLFSTYAGRKPDLEPWLRNATINRDRNLRLQYLAGLGLNLYQADVIYADMLRNVDEAARTICSSRSEATKQRPVRGDHARTGKDNELGLSAV